MNDGTSVASEPMDSVQLLETLSDRELLLFLVSQVEAMNERLDLQRDALNLIGQMMQEVKDEAEVAKAEFQQVLQNFGSNPLKAITGLMRGK